MSVTSLNFDIVDNIEDQQKLMDTIKTCSDSMARAKAEAELISENIKKTSKELGISKKTIKKLVTTYYKQNFDDEVASQEEFEILYTKIVK